MEDLSHWDAAVNFTAEEAVALIVGLEPDNVGADNLKVKPVMTRLAWCYRDTLLYYQSKYDPSKDCIIGFQTPYHQTIQSDEMITWTSQVPFPEAGFQCWLRDKDRSAFELQKFSRSELTHWLSAIDMKSEYLFLKKLQVESAKAAGCHKVLSERNSMYKNEGCTPQTVTFNDKPLATSERNTLLKLVIGMAMKGYRYDPKASKSPTTKEIVEDLDDLGMKVTDDTVRRYLKLAVNTVLPPEKRKL